ncbi:hypothetical protein [Rhizobium tibeticum]|nr:hypothetical protein [Rhizobium tibeticum]
MTSASRMTSCAYTIDVYEAAHFGRVGILSRLLVEDRTITTR